MKKLSLTITALATLALGAGQLAAQDQQPERQRDAQRAPGAGDRPPGDRPPGDRARGDRDGRPPGAPGGPGRPGSGDGERGEFRPPIHPLHAALDTDSNGELSAAEIAAASTALKKLDKDSDGKLSMEELRPAGGPPPFAGRPPGAPAAPGAPDGGSFTDRLMANDANKDGKLAKSELPERMQGMFERIDTNTDGFADKAELDAMAARFRDGGGRPPGAPGGDRGRGDGNRGPGGPAAPGGAGDAGPQRPQRPAAEP